MSRSEGLLPQMDPTMLEAECAYDAARLRALRTAEALIVAEGQVIQLSRQLARVTEERDRFAGQAEQLLEMRARRRMRDRARRARRRAERGDDATSEPGGPCATCPVGQAD